MRLKTHPLTFTFSGRISVCLGVSLRYSNHNLGKVRYRRVPSPWWEAPPAPAHGASDSLGTGTAEAGVQASLPSSFLMYLERFEVSGLDAWPSWAQISWEKWHHQSVDQSIHEASVSIRTTHPNKVQSSAPPYFSILPVPQYQAHACYLICMTILTEMTSLSPQKGELRQWEAVTCPRL